MSDINQNQDFNAHKFQQYKMKKDFLEELDREMLVDISRSFTSEEDIVYDGVNYELSDSEINGALLQVGVISHEESEFSENISKLRKRILKGPYR